MELDEAAWALLHELRLRGKVGGADSAPANVLVTRGFALRKQTVVVITAAGRDVHTAWARCEPGSDVEATLQRAYERFLPLNAELLRVCNDWQVRTANVVNDHTDAEYDWSVIERLRVLHDRISPVARSLANSIDRFAPYRARLRSALQRVENGENDWFTSPRLDSYHTVWMQLHEDLLLALGIERSSEVSA